MTHAATHKNTKSSVLSCFALRHYPHTQTPLIIFFPHQCLATVHRSLSPPTNANILTTLLCNLVNALPMQDAK